MAEQLRQVALQLVLQSSSDGQHSNSLIHGKTAETDDVAARTGGVAADSGDTASGTGDSQLIIMMSKQGLVT